MYRTGLQQIDRTHRTLQGLDTPDGINFRQREAIFRFSLTDNFDSSLNVPNI